MFPGVISPTKSQEKKNTRQNIYWIVFVIVWKKNNKKLNQAENRNCIIMCLEQGKQKADETTKVNRGLILLSSKLGSSLVQVIKVKYWLSRLFFFLQKCVFSQVKVRFSGI